MSVKCVCYSRTLLVALGILSAMTYHIPPESGSSICEMWRHLSIYTAKPKFESRFNVECNGEGKKSVSFWDITGQMLVQFNKRHYKMIWCRLRGGYHELVCYFFLIYEGKVSCSLWWSQTGFVNDLELAFLLYVGIIGMHYQPSSQFGFSIQNSSVMTSFNCQLDVTGNHLGRVSMKG